MNFFWRCIWFLVQLLSFVKVLNAAEEVNVYTERQTQFIEPVFDRFTQETGIVVNAIYSQTDLVGRIVQEGDQTNADLLIAVNVGYLIKAAESGIAAEIVSPLVEQNIPEDYRAKDGRWVGLTSRARVLFVRKDAVQDVNIETYEELAEPAWRKAICMRSGHHVYNVGLIASMIARHGLEYTQKWLRFLKDNLARKPQGSDSDQIIAVSMGDCRVAIANSYYYGKMLDDPDLREAASSLKVIFPNQGKGGTHMNITGVVMMKHAKNRENALKLIEFMTGTEIQHVYADINFEYPVGVVWPEMLRSWGEFEPEHLPLTVIASYQGIARQLLDDVGFDD